MAAGKTHRVHCGHPCMWDPYMWNHRLEWRSDSLWCGQCFHLCGTSDWREGTMSYAVDSGWHGRGSCGQFENHYVERITDGRHGQSCSVWSTRVDHMTGTACDLLVWTTWLAPQPGAACDLLVWTTWLGQRVIYLSGPHGWDSVWSTCVAYMAGAACPW